MINYKSKFNKSFLQIFYKLKLNYIIYRKKLFKIIILTIDFKVIKIGIIISILKRIKFSLSKARKTKPFSSRNFE